LTVLSHGIGNTKYSPQEPGTRNQEPGTRNQEPGTRNVFGLSAPWVLRDGKPYARALVLSHAHQLKQLAESAPAALPVAVVAGDPCFDRIVESLPFRQRYRDALGIGDRILVYVSSTWSTESTLGARPDLIRELLAELSCDHFVVCTAIHPNVRHRHGPGQFNHWFADCLRAGLIALPEIDGWRTGLIAADVIIGDCGSVTGYGAAIGRPVLLCSAPEIPPDTAVSALAQTAPRLPAHGPYLPHLESVIAEHTPERFDGVARLVTSVPGRSLTLLRSLLYRILNLDEPACEISPAILPAIDNRVTELPFAYEVTAVVDARERLVRLVRRPAEVQRAAIGLHTAERGAVHLSCSVDYPMRALLNRAKILAGISTDTDTAPSEWLHATLDRYPGCSYAVVLHGDTSIVMSRVGVITVLTGAGVPSAVFASAWCAWRDAGLEPGNPGTSITVELGSKRAEITIGRPPPDDQTG